MFHLEHDKASRPDGRGATSQHKPTARSVSFASASTALCVVAGVAIVLLRSASPWSPTQLQSDGSAIQETSGTLTSFWSDGPDLKPQQAVSEDPAEGDDARSEEDGLRAWLTETLPDHGFHPVVIHFPIALFLFGTLLELFGWWRKDFRVRQAAFWNLAAGSLSTLIVIPTGAVAFVLSDYTWKGMVVIHMVLAATAALLMAATVLWRRKGPLTSQVYFALLITTAIVLGVAGHFGGQLIYGL